VRTSAAKKSGVLPFLHCQLSMAVDTLNPSRVVPGWSRIWRMIDTLPCREILCTGISPLSFPSMNTSLPDASQLFTSS